MAKGGTTQKQESKPWEAQRPILNKVYNEGINLYDQKLPGVFTGPRVAGFTPDQLLAQNKIREFASPGGLGGQSMGYMGDVVGGKYLDAGNPHFGAMAGRIAESVIPQVSSALESSGRTGGGVQTDLISKALADKIGDLAYADYGAERGYQQQAAGQAPGIAQQILAMLGQSGDQQQGQAQRVIQGNMDLFNDRNNIGWERLSRLAAAGGAGGQYPTTTTTAPGPSLVEQLLGGALGGASLAGGLGWAPFG